MPQDELDISVERRYRCCRLDDDGNDDDDAGDDDDGGGDDGDDDDDDDDDDDGNSTFRFFTIYQATKIGFWLAACNCVPPFISQSVVLYWDQPGGLVVKPKPGERDIRGSNPNFRG